MRAAGVPALYSLQAIQAHAAAPEAQRDVTTAISQACADCAHACSVKGDRAGFMQLHTIHSRTLESQYLTRPGLPLNTLHLGPIPMTASCTTTTCNQPTRQLNAVELRQNTPHNAVFEAQSKDQSGQMAWAMMYPSMLQPNDLASDFSVV